MPVLGLGEKLPQRVIILSERLADAATRLHREFGDDEIASNTRYERSLSWRRIAHVAKAFRGEPIRLAQLRLGGLNYKGVSAVAQLCILGHLPDHDGAGMLDVTQQQRLAHQRLCLWTNESVSRCFAMFGHRMPAIDRWLQARETVWTRESGFETTAMDRALADAVEFLEREDAESGPLWSLALRIRYLGENVEEFGRGRGGYYFPWTYDPNDALEPQFKDDCDIGGACIQAVVDHFDAALEAVCNEEDSDEAEAVPMDWLWPIVRLEERWQLDRLEALFDGSSAAPDQPKDIAALVSHLDCLSSGLASQVVGRLAARN